MGTSSAYSPPSGGAWGELKNHLTRYTKDSSNRALESQVISEFIGAIGGSKEFPKSNSYGGKGGVFSSKSAKNTARNIIGFLSDIQNNGLEKALEKHGLTSLKDKTIDDIKDELVDYFSEPVITGDSDAARKAAEKSLDEILINIDDISELEKKLSIFELEQFLCDFFANYIAELFEKSFGEEYKNKDNVDRKEASKSLAIIEDDIRERVKSCQLDKQLSKIDWNGEEGQKMIEEILYESLELIRGNDES